jgi:hypothetical protein
MLSLPAYARGRVALAREQFGEAYEHLLRIFDPSAAAFHPFVRGWALADLADAAVRGDGDLDAVRGYLAEWEQVAAATRAPHLEVQVAYAAAILATDAVAERHFRVAIASAQADWPFYAARAQLAYGAWLRRHRRMTQSRAPLREAAETFEALGLLRYAERARRELRASGETVRRRDPEPGLSCHRRSFRSPSSRPRASRIGKSVSSSISHTGPSNHTCTGSSQS